MSWAFFDGLPQAEWRTYEAKKKILKTYGRKTSTMKDQKKMDASTVCQWRKMRLKKYARCPKPFHYCNEIGLDLNLASNREKKLDLQLLTNGVMLEVCDFAETITKSEGHFITMILENNFDLGLENEQQRLDFTVQILHKVKDLFRNHPKDKHEVFPLFDTSSEPDSNNTNVLSMASIERMIESFQMESSDCRDSEHEEAFQCPQATSQKCIKTQSLSEELDGDNAYEHEFQWSGEKLTKESFPLCEEIGLNFDIGSKQKLDPGLLTKFVMLEVVQFTRVLTASLSCIVLDVLEHNFELDLKDQQVKKQIWFKISQLLKRRRQLETETFSFQTNTLKRPRESDSCNAEALQWGEITTNDMEKITKKIESEEVTKKHRREQYEQSGTNTFSQYTDLSEIAEDDYYYTCPLEETDLDSNEISNSGNAESQDHIQDQTSPDIPTTDINMWELRANQVKEILSSSNKQFNGLFDRCKKIGLQFNVGISQRKDMRVDAITNSVLLEIAKFALAMNSSQQDFIMEILEYNFKLNLATKQRRKAFACEMMSRVRRLLTCDDSVKFSNEIFELPGSVSSTNEMKETVGIVRPKLMKVEIDDHPFCEEIGLKLHLDYSQQHKRLHLKRLTNGAMTEVANFAEKLCGTFEQVCLDILRHNLDLDLQNTDPDVANRMVAQIPAVMTELSLETSIKGYRAKNINHRITSTKEEMDYQNNPISDPCSASSSQTPIAEQKSFESKHKNELNPMLWKLRANHIQHILSVHEEHCPLYSYSRCKKLGIDFNVGSGVKQNLDPKLLTNGIMIELNAFVQQLLSAHKYFMTEILEHNCSLNFKNELCREDFANQMKAIFRDVKAHKSKVSQMMMPVELPDTSRLKELAPQCAKCYQERNHKPQQDGYDMHRPRSFTMTGEHPADKDCTAQNDPSLSFSKVKKILMGPYPACKSMGFNLFMDEYQPSKKFDTGLLTCRIIKEVGSFAQKLCGTRLILLNDVIEHNFAIDAQSQDPISLFYKVMMQKDKGHIKLNESIFAGSPVCPRPHGHARKVKCDSAMHHSERRESVRKRALALQTTANQPSRENYFPLCSAIGLDLDMTTNLREKKMLDLRLLTKAVVLEINEFASGKTECFFPRTVCDILDYNFDLSSQHHRRWEFAIATASKIQTLVKGHCENQNGEDEIFELPFLSYPKVTQRFAVKRQNKGSQTLNSGILQKDSVKQEGIEPENDFTCPLESDLDSDEDPEIGNTDNQDHLENSGSCSQSSDIPKESGSSCLGNCAPSVTSSEVALTFPPANPNVNTYHQPEDNQGPCGSEDQTQTPIISPNGCDMEQEEMGTQNSLWKMRSNRVEQIISPLNKVFSTFNMSRKVGLEYNVGFGPKQNISVDLLTKGVLLEIAKFALAINSSQQDFITEILEHNFDLGLLSEHHRAIFKQEIMKRVRKLRTCEDAVKFSSEVFDLPGAMPSTNKMSHSLENVVPELLNIPKVVKDPPGYESNVNDHPFCKDIGLKLHVSNNQTAKKLDVSKLTNGAMTEVANFAEKLCGTFEQICLDILRHNLDPDSESPDSDLARDIVARMGDTSLTTHVKHKPLKDTRREISSLEALDYQNNTVLESPSPDSSQAPVPEQNVGTSSEIKHSNEPDLKLWQARANRIEYILSIPHEEHCPLYSFSRCKKQGIDFNVGSGVKKNLDPMLLTEGILVEFVAFSKEMSSSWKYFVTDILEYNFDLNLNSELCRIAFTLEVGQRVRTTSKYTSKTTPFKLPDTSSLHEPAPQCPKCYQDRHHKLHQDVLHPGHMQQPHLRTTTDTVSAEEDSKAEKSTTEENIMKDFPLCKKIGLTLCMDKDKPKHKLDTSLLTNKVVKEVYMFAKRLCSTRNKIIQTLVEHNFNIGRDVNLERFNHRVKVLQQCGSTSLSQVFVIPRVSHSQRVSSGKVAPKTERSEVLESIKKRKLALQAKQCATPPGQNVCAAKKPCKRDDYPICREIGLELNVKSKARGKRRLDLKVLTRAVVYEIYKFAITRKRQHFTTFLFEILDYNFDLRSEHHRQREFSLATAYKVQHLVKRYRKNRNGAHVVFKLPFWRPRRTSQRGKIREMKELTIREKRQYKRREKKQEERHIKCKHPSRTEACHPGDSCVIWAPRIKTEEPWYGGEETVFLPDRRTINWEMNEDIANADCGSFLEYDPFNGIVKEEPYDEEESHTTDTVDVQHLVQREPAEVSDYPVFTFCPIPANVIETEVNDAFLYDSLAEPQWSER